MESKYLQRAIEIFNNIEWIDPRDKTPWLIKDCIIEAMCKLAEEVEAAEILNKITKEDVDKLSKSYENCVGMYTKEQVEVLLEKQRRLCFENAKFNYLEINEDSILNAKLKLE